ncbi:MAG TPA: NYN domain-containing protein [Candidatus Nealsonbacteria bacterium]|nr:NYN domain-containing protein [Candidatus Nealsonbacteria bacterium]HEB46778.1 NYN domain-containing protein [Candidatus Nealsonbacteria bacterium]
MFFRRPKRNRVLFLIDFENILKNLKQLPSPEDLSFLAGFDRIVKEIAREIGEIVDVFIFLPPHLASIYGEDLYRAGFFIIVCPKVRDKAGEQIDTTDETLIRFGQRAIDELNITHLCLGSGDKDFGPLVRRATRKGLKIIIATASQQSLATELITLADRIFFYSPTE